MSRIESIMPQWQLNIRKNNVTSPDLGKMNPPTANLCIFQHYIDNPLQFQRLLILKETER